MFKANNKDARKMSLINICGCTQNPMPRTKNTKLDSYWGFILWGELVSLLLVGNPSIDAVLMKYLCGGTLHLILSAREILFRRIDTIK